VRGKKNAFEKNDERSCDEAGKEEEGMRVVPYTFLICAGTRWLRKAVITISLAFN
jgi:hypothetical protein